MSAIYFSGQNFAGGLSVLENPPASPPGMIRLDKPTDFVRLNFPLTLQPLQFDWRGFENFASQTKTIPLFLQIGIASKILGGLARPVNVLQSLMAYRIDEKYLSVAASQKKRSKNSGIFKGKKNSVHLTIMLLPLCFIFLLTIGGFCWTYLLAENEPLLWRICAGHIIGSALFGLICFLVANLFAFNSATILLSLSICLAPLALFSKNGIRQKIASDWKAAGQNFKVANARGLLHFAYYAAFLTLFYSFYQRAFFETNAGIFTGASNNLGDLPFHLGAIFSFSDGHNFPPQNPSFAGVKFSYPLMVDFIASAFIKLGATARHAMLVQNVLLSFSLLVILERFTFKLTGNRVAGKIAPLLLFFSGGLGFLWFFKDASQAKNLYDFILNLPRDYTIGEEFRWGNSLTTLFITQRSLLLGMPLTLIVLQKMWGISNASSQQNENRFILDYSHWSAFLVGLLAGTLPLIHLHSLLVLLIVSAFLFCLSFHQWRTWSAFIMGALIVAVPELIWTMTGSATKTSEFIGWHFGWDSGGENIFWFWLKNTGIVIPFALFAIILMRKYKGAQSTKLLLFSIPFALLFVIANVLKLAPWEWDNIKILIYWFVGFIPLMAFALAWLWQKNSLYKIIAVACGVLLTGAGALDVWRVASGAVDYQVFDADAIEIAQQIKQTAAADALFLNAPTYNTAVVLTGRRSLMRYIGHLSSHGIDYGEREADLKRIYAGGAETQLLLQKYGIDYVLVSPEEHNYFQANKVLLHRNFFRNFPVAAQSGAYKVYQVNKSTKPQ